MLKQRKYVDFYAAVGRKCVPDNDLPYSHEVLLDDMKYARVHGALIVPNTAQEYSFVFGNKEGIELSKNNKRFNLIAPVPTTAVFETDDKNYYDNLLKSGAVALAASPSMHCTYTPKSIEPIAASLINYNKPLVYIGPLNENVLCQVEEISSAFPELPIVMHGASWGFGRTIISMLERCNNVHFEISSFHLNNLFNIAKDNFGVDKVLFGTSWPVKSMGAMKAYVEYADISEAEKDLVAHGNACRLFGLDVNDFELYDDNDCQLDEIALEADQGKPISVPVFDAHTHMVCAEDMAVNNCVMKYSDCDSIAKKMDTLGVDSIITAPWSGISLDGIMGNEETLDAARKHLGKFYGYLTCNVNYREELNKVLEYHKEYPDVFKGIKPYPPYQKFDFSDEACREWFEYANAHHLPALIHADGVSYIDMVEKVVGKYPNITFIIAHTGASYPLARRAIKLAKEYDNVVLEITYTTTGRGMVEFLVSEVGADRVLYGSDLPMRDPTPQLAWVCYADISVTDKKKILAENFKKILSEII